MSHLLINTLFVFNRSQVESDNLCVGLIRFSARATVAIPLQQYDFSALSGMLVFVRKVGMKHEIAPILAQFL